MFNKSRAEVTFDEFIAMFGARRPSSQEELEPVQN